MEKIIKQLKKNIEESRGYLPELAEAEDSYNFDGMTADEIEDLIMNNDNGLDFEVGFMRGLQFAVELLEKSK